MYNKEFDELIEYIRTYWIYCVIFFIFIFNFVGLITPLKYDEEYIICCNLLVLLIFFSLFFKIPNLSKLENYKNFLIFAWFFFTVYFYSLLFFNYFYKFAYLLLFDIAWIKIRLIPKFIFKNQFFIKFFNFINFMLKKTLINLNFFNLYFNLFIKGSFEFFILFKYLLLNFNFYFKFLNINTYLYFNLFFFFKNKFIFRLKD